MRIISGKYKGRRLSASKNLPSRPTTDMAKEALFNILNNRYYFNELVVLDLFAGIGSISFEFASRGTPSITSVDKHYGCVRFIKETAAQLEFDMTVLKSDVFSFLEKTHQKADVIFADPPYNFSTEDFTRVPTLVFERSLLNEEGMLIVEHSKHTNLSGLEFFSFEKKYGSSAFSFFEWTP